MQLVEKSPIENNGLILSRFLKAININSTNLNKLSEKRKPSSLRQRKPSREKRQNRRQYQEVSFKKSSSTL
jgi:hypothetical protein